MENTTMTIPVETRPSFGTPVYGCAFGTTSARTRIESTHAWAGFGGVAGADVAQGSAVLVKGDAFPGTSAWRPPNC